MKTRSFTAGLCWVVLLGIGCCGLNAVPGLIAPAFAEIGGDGTISGTFFVNNSPFMASQGYPGARQAAVAPQAGTGICEQGIALASLGQQLPPGLLGAIAVVESGRLDPRSGAMKPWPWTIDANGTGYVYDSAQSAIAAANGFEAAGITSLDVGCLQVNLAQHPDPFATLAQAFDPVANARFAAAFLTSLDQKFGNWPQAVAAYHSQTPALGEPYAAKVYAAWQGAGVPGTAPVALAAFAGQSVLPGRSAGSITRSMASPVTAAMPPVFDMSALTPPMAMLGRGRTLDNRGLASYRAAPVAIAFRMVPQG